LSRLKARWAHKLKARVPMLAPLSSKSRMLA
jgi:hypothetical protein